MKKIFAAMFITASFAFASAQTISFDKTTVDYGTVKNGADGNRVFVVKNTGDKPLIISKVQASCGCTIPEWSQEPIMPGKTGQIKVHYDTKIGGPFQKLIQVYSNDPANVTATINIKGTVEQANAQPATSKGEVMLSNTATLQAAPAKAEVLKTEAAAKKQAKKLGKKADL